MGYEVHVIRQSDSRAEVHIPLEEWNKLIESDPDFVPPPVSNINYGKNLFCLPTNSTDPDDWPWIAWTNGRIHSKYRESSVLKKLSQMSRHFGAVVMSDDGDFWSMMKRGVSRFQTCLKPLQVMHRPQRRLQVLPIPNYRILSPHHFLRHLWKTVHNLGSSRFNVLIASSIQNLGISSLPKQSAYH